MDSLDINNTTETHPLFPSGEWEGFYTYEEGPAAQRSMMYFTLYFENKVVTGGGSDNVGSFVWKGTYDTQALWCKMTKHYVTHTVDYDGHVDENGIWGKWTISLRSFVYSTGGFHIWPKKTEEVAESAEVERIELDVKVKVPVVVTV